MPFFPRFHYPERSTYSPFPTDILRLLAEDFDTPSTTSESSSNNTGRRAFSPNFDVHETEHEYVLEGELPGLAEKKDVNIEFTDDKTISVHGRIERVFRAYAGQAGQVKEIEGGEQKHIESAPEAGQEAAKEKEKGKEKEKDSRPKYWVSERQIGEFSRSFSFPTSVDIDRVKASLDHGILKVVVPKLEKKAGRRIEIA